MWVAQAAPNTGPDLVAQWLQYGVLGAVLLALVLGWLWAKPAVDRIIKENEKLRDRLDKCEEERRQELRELRREVERLMGQRREP